MKEELARLWRDIQQTQLKIDAEDDRRKRNYSSAIFEHGMRWRYWELKHKNRRVRHCYTTTANALGCYLTFKEIIIGKRKMRVKRENIAPHETRREAKAWALRKYDEAKAALKTTDA